MTDRLHPRAATAALAAPKALRALRPFTPPVCRDLPTRALNEPLEFRRLLSGSPAAFFDPARLPGAVVRPDGTIVEPRVEPQVEPVGGTRNTGGQADTQGFFSTTPAPSAKTGPNADWGTDAASASTSSGCGSKPLVSVGGAGCGAGEAGPTPGYFYFTASGGSGSYGSSGSGLTISYTLPYTPPGLGRAEPGVDYNGPLVGGSATIPAGYSIVYVPFTPLQDNLVEGTEVVTVKMTASSSYEISGASEATTTISDDPPLVSIAKLADGSEDPDPASSPASLAPKAVKFRATRTGGLITSPVNVGYAIAGGTAAAADFGAPGNSLAITDEKILILSVVDDTEVEPRESVHITLKEDPAASDANPATLPTYLLVAAEADAQIADNDYFIRAAQVGFNDQGVVPDKGGPRYGNPQWLDAVGNADGTADGKDETETRPAATPDIGAPVSYARSTPKVGTTAAAPRYVTASPQFVIEFKDDNVLTGSFRIEGAGTGTGGGAFAGATTPSPIPGTMTATLAGAFTSDKALPETIDSGDLGIDWKLRRTVKVGALSAKPTVAYGKTKNHIYVTGVAAPDAFETVLDLGCEGANGERPGNPGEAADKAKTAVDKTIAGVWGKFSTADKPANPKRVDGVPIVYDPSQLGHTAATPLSRGDGHGQCSALADLLLQTFSAQGIEGKPQFVEGAGVYTKFQVRNGPVQGGIDLAAPRTKFGWHVMVLLEAQPDRVYDASFGAMTAAAPTETFKQTWERTHVIDFFDSSIPKWIGSNPAGEQLIWSDKGSPS